MAETKVSDDFIDFYNKEADAISKAKEAESRMANIPLEVGTEGVCTVVSLNFSKTPGTKDEKTGEITKAGCPFCQIAFRVIDNPEHQGKLMSRTWWFWEKGDKTRADNFKEFLDYLENRMGLPREVRTGHQHPKELGNWYLENGPVIHFKISEAKNEMDDNKRIDLSMPKDVVPPTADILPPKQNAAPVSTPAPTTPSSSFKKGDKVRYMEEIWNVTDVFDTKLQVQNVDDPRMEKFAPKTACELCS
jgi:hypothetical protein